MQQHSICMAHFPDMRALLLSQQRKVQQVFEDTAVYRRRLLSTKAGDRSLSFFRMQAETHSRELLIKLVTGEPLRPEARDFFSLWLEQSDAECEVAQQALRDFIDSVERVTGTIITI